MKNEIQEIANSLGIEQHKKYPNKAAGAANQSSAPAEKNSPLQGVGGEAKDNRKNITLITPSADGTIVPLFSKRGLPAGRQGEEGEFKNKTTE